MEILVAESLMNEILQYLGSRPYVEVAQIINRIAQEIERTKAMPKLVPMPKE